MRKFVNYERCDFEESENIVDTSCHHIKLYIVEKNKRYYKNVEERSASEGSLSTMTLCEAVYHFIPVVQTSLHKIGIINSI